MYRFGDFELDARRHELRHRGRPVHLAPQPFRLLEELVLASGALVSRAALERALWGEGTFVDAESGINFCVRTLRRTLAEASDGAAPIQTVPRLGYRLAIPVVLADDEATADSAARQPSLPVTTRRGWRLPVALAAALLAGTGVMLAVRHAAPARCDVAVAISDDGLPDTRSIAGAFEAEVVAGLLDRAQGRGGVLLAPTASGPTCGRLEAKFLAIPAGLRSEFRLLSGAAQRVTWQSTVEMSADRWFYGRSTLAEGVAAEAGRRLWPTPLPARDPEVATRVVRARAALEEHGAAAGEAALRALDPALQRASDDAELHALASRARLARWDVHGAETEARRALELDAASAEAELALSAALSAQGRHGAAIEAAFRARKLAPLDATVQAGLGRALLFGGRAEQAAEVSTYSVSVLPEVAQLWRWRSLALSANGEHALAGAALARALRLSGGAKVAEELEKRLDDAAPTALRGAWRAELEGRYGAPPPSPAARATLLALLGEREPALVEMERSIAAREESPVFFAVAPWFAPLRGDARFEALIRRIAAEGAS